MKRKGIFECSDSSCNNLFFHIEVQNRSVYVIVCIIMKDLIFKEGRASSMSLLTLTAVASRFNGSSG